MFWKKKKKAAKPSREAILAQAKATASSKREEIGDEALDQIRRAIMNKENSVLEQAKKAILAADEDKVRDNISFMMRDKE